jgi:hypothetical protein
MGGEALHLLREQQTDRFACDVLDQVLAERNMGVNQ